MRRSVAGTAGRAVRLARHRAALRGGRRFWTEEFQELMAHKDIDCQLGAVPYYEGHPLVAVVFGWPGCTAEQMAPYAALYERMGMPCVVMCPQLTEFYSLEDAHMRVVRLFAELQVELCNLRTDLVLHFFSASSHFYLGPCVYLGRKVTKGVVFDSGPVVRNMRKPGQNQLRIPHCMELLRKEGLMAWPRVNDFLHKVRASYLEWWQGWEADAKELVAQELLFCPQLILRSENDPSIDKDAFNEYIENQRSLKDLRVWEVMWPGEGHCGHLERHPEEYETALRDFVWSVKELPVEMFEVGRGAGAEWPPGIPTDEEMKASSKLLRPYVSPFHEREIARQKKLAEIQGKNMAIREITPEGVPMYRYPDGVLRAEPPPMDETQKYLEETQKEFPDGVLDLRGRQEFSRVPPNAFHQVDEVMPVDYRVPQRDFRTNQG